MRYFIECAYKGTNYCGWQIQNNAVTVQEIIEKALSTLLKKKTEIAGSSRTDTGVHAMQQMAHFEVENENLDIENLVFRMNRILPFDISISQIYAVADDYHCRFEATSRKYEYHISRKKNPFQQGLAYEFSGDLDIDKMNQACQVLFKHIDFECFSKVNTQVFTFNCTISEARWEITSDNSLVFHIKANRFLRGMVRAIVGTLLEVGTGKISILDFEQIVLSKNRKNAGRAVPAQGLFLMEVNY
ncbi:MAG: tRNA pseudouridine(38-40) synthase TruA [Bacteroidota bacterium]